MNFLNQVKRTLKDRTKMLLIITMTIMYICTSIILLSGVKENAKATSNINKTVLAVSDIVVQETQRTIDDVHEKNKRKEEIDKVTDEIIKLIQEENQEEEITLPEPYYNPYNVTESSNITYEQMRDMLEGNRLQSIAHVFVDCEKQYGINALFLFGMAALESGNGTSYRAQTQNNLTGFAVYSDMSEGRTFSSWEECIEASAIVLNRDYLSEDGDYYVGTSSWNINVYWANSKTWAEEINDIVNEYIYKYKNS